jgi:hypothetical protein
VLDGQGFSKCRAQRHSRIIASTAPALHTQPVGLMGTDGIQFGHSQQHGARDR